MCNTINPVQLIKVIGRNVRLKRKEKRITQEDLAILCETSRTHIARIEKGECNCTLVTLEKITTALGEDMVSFLGDCTG